ncbi:MAG: sugar ABC transporter substrate-binding protein [Armatimonadetes bacterium]|nr:sugar ABC transporter substrate-binding protein [Armatimonadota bacterium]
MKKSPGVTALKIAVAGLALVLFNGCAQRPATDTLQIRWVADPNPVRLKQIAGFERDNPRVKVNLDPDAGSQKVLTQLAGGIYPDLFAIYDPASIQVFAKKGVLEDLRPLMKRYGIEESEFWPQLKPYMEHQGIICGLPDNCGPYVVFYNRRLFREAGVAPPEEGWTWDDLMDKARKLTQRDKRGRITRFGIGYIEPWILFWQYGGRMFSPDGKRCVIDSPQCKAAARYWASFRLTEHVTPTASEEQSLAALGSWGGAGNLFKAERLAMYVAGRWMSIEYRKNKNLEWDVAPVPRHGQARDTLLASKVYAIPKGCKNKEEAFKFLRHLISKEGELLVASTGDGIPSIRRFAETQQFLFNPEFPSERNNQVWLDEMKYARPPELSPYVSNLDTQTIFDEEMDVMWQGGQSPEKACENIARRVTALIRRNIANPNLMD